jgi:hypothetical protein
MRLTPLEGSPRSRSLARWRQQRLRVAGVPSPLARWVATRSRADLHQLLELIDRGCPPELAVRIVAPLDERPPC